MAHGVVTSRLARLLQQELDQHGFDVLYDHGQQGIDPKDNLGKIKSCMAQFTTPKPSWET